MTDKELLELAAKANGTNGEYVDNAPIGGEYRTGFYDRLTERCWNPLGDDGDALRLSVKLGIDVLQLKQSKSAYANTSQVFFLDDSYAATRRAIVRAAAEIGKNL